MSHFFLTASVTSQSSGLFSSLGRFFTLFSMGFYLSCHPIRVRCPRGQSWILFLPSTFLSRGSLHRILAPQGQEFLCDFFPVLFSYHIKQYLVHQKCSVDICWIDELQNDSELKALVDNLLLGFPTLWTPDPWFWSPPVSPQEWVTNTSDLLRLNPSSWKNPPVILSLPYLTAVLREKT